MELKPLLETLRSVAPALAKDALISPALGCFAFQKKEGKGTVTASNDVITISGPCPLGDDFEGGLPGGFLLGFLGSAAGKEVEISKREGNELTLKAGASKIRLTHIPIASIPLPKVQPELQGNITPSDELKEALRKAAIGMGVDETFVWRLGVTIEVAKTKKGLQATLLSSDSLTLSEVKCPIICSEDKILASWSPQFVDALLAMWSHKPTVIGVLEDGTIVNFEDGFTLFGRAVADPRTKSHTDMWEQVKGESDASVAIHADLAPAISRAMVLKAAPPGAPAAALVTSISIAKDTLRLKTETPFGTITDRIPVTCGGEASIRIIPQHLHRVLDEVKDMTILPNALLLKGDGFTHAISAVHSA